MNLIFTYKHIIYLITAIVIVYGIMVVVSFVPVKCADFKSQKQAQRALDRGMHSLDRDKDGIACEAML